MTNEEKELILKSLKENNNINPDEISFVNADDTVQVGCAACGDCCRNRNDILFKAIDFYKICKGLDLKLEEFMHKYCTSYFGHSSNLLIFSLKFKETIFGETVCPFLRRQGDKALCSIHGFKPNVCRIYPFGRMSSLNGELGYIMQKPDCESKNVLKDTVVSDWIGSDYLIYEKSLEQFNKIQTALNNKIKLKELISYETTNEQKMKIFSHFLNCIYRYDLDKTLEENVNSDTNLKAVDEFVAYVATINRKLIKKR